MRESLYLPVKFLVNDYIWFWIQENDPMLLGRQQEFLSDSAAVGIVVLEGWRFSSLGKSLAFILLALVSNSLILCCHHLL